MGVGLQAQQDVAGAYEFDPAEDDADDSLEEQDEKGDDNLDDQVNLCYSVDLLY